MMLRRSLSVILLFSLSLLQGEAEDLFRFRHISLDDGLPSNSVRGIAQDELGRIWFAAEGYISCYDGVGITNVAVDFGNSSGSFPDHYVKDIKCGSPGSLWCATDIGLIHYDYIHNVFNRIDTPSGNGAPISSIVSSLAQDGSGTIWCATFGQGVFSYDPSVGSVSQYHLESEDLNVYCVYTDADDNVWASLLDASCPLYRLDRTRDEFVPVRTVYDITSSRSGVGALCEDSYGNFWLGSWDGGLQKLDRGSGTVSTCCFKSPDGSSMVTHIHSIAEYRDGEILVGSDDGLTLFDTRSGKYRTFEPDMGNPNAISDSFIYPLMKDSEGGMWIGTYYKGVNYIPPGSGRFEGDYLAGFTRSRYGHIVSHITEGPDSTVWIAMDDMGLIHYYPDTGQAVHYMPGTESSSLSYHNIHSLCFDGTDLWIGTYTGGINVLDTKTGRFRRPDVGDASSVDNSSVYSLMKDRNGDIWAGSLAGISRYDRSSGHFVLMLPLSHTPVSLIQDRRGRIWCATLGGGLYRYTPSNLEWVRYRKDDLQNSQLSSDYVTGIYIGADERMWLSTKEGLCYFDEASGHFVRVYIDDVTVNDFTAVTGDGSSLWITSSAGLIRYFPDGRAFVFNKSDGLISDQYLPNSIMKASDGRIYVGSDNGFSSFYPEKVETNGYIPPVLITGLRLEGKELTVQEGSTLPKAIPYLEKITLPRRSRVVGFSFAALSYQVPEKNRYAYMLEGFDQDWQNAVGGTDASYTNLPYGTYRFRVKASNNDGLWNDEGTSLTVVLPPPLLLSLPFTILYILLFGLAVFLVIRGFFRRAEMRHQETIERLNREKEQELYESKMEFFSTIAHEIRTPVSLIIAPIEKIKEENLNLSEEMKEDLDVMDRNSRRLLKLVTDLLDFRKMETPNAVRLHLVRSEINELVLSVTNRFRKPLRQSGTALTVSLPEIPLYADVDSEAFTKILANLLSNAKKYASGVVSVGCSVPDGSRFFELVVKDDGQGIEADQMENIFKPFYRVKGQNRMGTGLGLSIVHSLVEAHHGSVSVSSSSGQGAVFTVRLPLEQPDAAGTDAREGDFLPETASSVSDGRGSKPGILVVEDNKDLLVFLTRSLSDDFTVHTADGGVAALDLLHKVEISFILSDWMMPDMDGAELCRRVREDSSLSHIPFVMLTARTDEDSKVESMNIGADAFIEKPFSMAYLKAQIRNLLEMRKVLVKKYSNMPLVPIASVAANPVEVDFLNRMKELIEQNFSNPELSVNFLASELCISRSGLFSKIKSLMDVTPNELIQIVRLKKGAELLLENKYLVNEICYMVGFSSPSYFSKCFQKQFGMKPNEFVRSVKKC